MKSCTNHHHSDVTALITNYSRPIKPAIKLMRIWDSFVLCITLKIAEKY